MVDFWPRPERTYEDLILKKMRPGDIHTHVFAQQFPIILPDGKINPALAQARARGVIFDVGHGSGSFWFRNAVRAEKQGFIPDSISTDLHTGNYTVVRMQHEMSKFLAMGEARDDGNRRSTPTCSSKRETTGKERSATLLRNGATAVTARRGALSAAADREASNWVSA